MAMQAVFIDKATGEVVETVEQGNDTFNAFRDRTYEISKKYPVEQYNMIHDSTIGGTNMNLTELEKILMSAIPKDQFYESGLDSIIWTDCFIDYCGVPSKQARGVLVSLDKKGLIYVSGGKEGTINLTEKGKEYITNLTKIEEEKKMARTYQYQVINAACEIINVVTAESTTQAATMVTPGCSVKRITTKQAESIFKVIKAKEEKSKEVKKTVVVDMSKAKAPKTKKNKVIVMGEKNPKKSHSVLTEQQEATVMALKEILIKEDGKSTSMSQPLINEKGLAVIKTQSKDKSGTEKYRTIYIGKRGGYAAWGKRPGGTPKYLTIPKEVIAYGYSSTPEELRG